MSFLCDMGFVEAGALIFRQPKVFSTEKSGADFVLLLALRIVLPVPSTPQPRFAWAAWHDAWRVKLAVASNTGWQSLLDATISWPARKGEGALGQGRQSRRAMGAEKSASSLAARDG